MISIAVKKTINATPLQVREILLEHQQLNRFFNAEFMLIRKQNEGEIEGGKGAIRQVSMMGIKFEEVIVSADEHHIFYQIMGNKPVSEHRGNIHFSQSNNTITPNTEVSYHISCKAPWWLPTFLLSFFIKKDVKQALNKLAINFNVNT
ncbi:MAG: SRPBCC family protein [Colwellia sp.]|nr:SRPBCC family protein [Colwellia sp.]